MGNPIIRRMSDARPVGVFDSGIGGVTVLREIRAQHSAESCLYFADTREAPYGSRPAAFIQDRTERAVDFLLDRGAKLVVVACNAASVVSLAHLRARYEVPFVGIVPAVKPAAAMTERGVIGVLTTPATAESRPLAQLIEQFTYGVKVVTQVCPGLVPLVERGVVDGPEIERLLRCYLEPLLDSGADVIVLGCTHYPFLREPIQEICGPAVKLVDPAEAVARQLGRVLDEASLRTDAGAAAVAYYTTGDPRRFSEILSRLTDRPAEPVQRADI